MEEKLKKKKNQKTCRLRNGKNKQEIEDIKKEIREKETKRKREGRRTETRNKLFDLINRFGFCET